MNNKLRIAGIVEESIVDGPGIRLVVFFQGCKHACKGCHNPETWDFNKGKIIEPSSIINLYKKNPLLDGITLSGGDPFYQIEQCLALVRLIKKENIHLLIFTGFLFEELLEMSKMNKSILEILSLTDVLIDGPYKQEKRDISLRFRGSSNQRIIDVKKSIIDNSIQLIKLDD